MKATYTPDQFNKLPKWAQSYIDGLVREREVAVHALNQYPDCQTPSPFYYEDALCTGESQGPAFKKIYINTRFAIKCEHGGVVAELHIDNHDKLQCSFEPAHHGYGRVAIQPECSNVITFVKIKDQL